MRAFAVKAFAAQNGGPLSYRAPHRGPSRHYSTQILASTDEFKLDIYSDLKVTNRISSKTLLGLRGPRLSESFYALTRYLHEGGSFAKIDRLLVHEIFKRCANLNVVHEKRRNQILTSLLSLKSSMNASNTALLPSEYIIMLDIASRLRKFDVSDAIWSDLKEHGVKMTLPLLNAKLWAFGQAYSAHWPLRKSTSSSQREAAVNGEPALSYSARDFLEEVRSLGLMPDSRSYELLVLHYGRYHNLPMCREIVSQVWLGSKTDIMPSSRSVSAVIDAFSYNGSFMEGWKIAQQLLERYPRVGTDSSVANRILQRLVTAISNREVKPTCFYDVWDVLISKWVSSPDAQLWKERAKFLVRFRDFEAVNRDVHTIMGSSKPRAAKVKLASWIVKKQVERMAQSHSGLDAVKTMGVWQRRGLVFDDQLQSRLERISAAIGSEIRMQIDDEEDDDSFGF